jgi:hypothetical protein
MDISEIFTLPNSYSSHLVNVNKKNMKVKVSFSIIFCATILFASCLKVAAKDKELPFMRNGISFSIAEDWKITANDSIGENAYYFSAERSGSKATGLIIVTWANKIEDPQKTILTHQQSMRNANMYRNPGIEFALLNPENFAGLKVLSCNYTTIVKDQKLDGVIYCFNSSGKTVTIFLQSGLTDAKINQKAFELFRKTFNCRE